MLFLSYLLALHKNFPTPPALNLIVLVFPLPGFAVFGDEFLELAEVALLGAEPVEGGAVDFGVDFGGGEKRMQSAILFFYVSE